MSARALFPGDICGDPADPSLATHRLLERARFVPNAWVALHLATKMRCVVRIERLCLYEPQVIPKAEHRRNHRAAGVLRARKVAAEIDSSR